MKSRTAEVMEQVKAVAAAAEYEVEEQHARQTLSVTVSTTRDRTQTVYIDHSGQTPDGHDTICFFSPCRAFGRGMLSGLGKRDAINLLRRNKKLPWGHFALHEFDGEEEVLMVCSDQLVETMDVDELKTHINWIAIIADAYEIERGGADRF